MGDFNIYLLKFQTHGKTNDFMESIISKGSLPLITKPTRVTTYSATLLDHIYSKATSQNYDSGIIISDVADHFGTFYASRKCSRKDLPIYTRTRQMKQVNISNFKQLLSSTDFNQCFLMNIPILLTILFCIYMGKAHEIGTSRVDNIDISYFSPRSMQWLFQTPRLSVVHVKKNVSHILL